MNLNDFSLRKLFPLALISTCLAVPLAGCDFQLGPSDDNNNGGNNGGGNNGGGGSIGGGNDGGATIGTLTDASDLEVNFDSNFSLGNIDISIDDIPAVSSDLEDGMVVTLIIEDGAPSNLATGTVTSLEVNHLLVGPVTSLNPFEVLSHEVITTADTELRDISGEDVTNLAIGDIARVSGFANRQNGILATRVDLQPGQFSIWKMTGTVENLTANQSFTIADQNIILNGTFPDCGTRELAEGDYVEVTAIPEENFSPGDDLSTLLAVECLTVALPALRADDDDIETLPAQMEGTVTSINSITEIFVDDQEIELGSNVSYLGGTATDLIVGAKIEVEGDLDLDTQVLTANTIIYHERRILIEAPLASSDVTVNTSVNFFGLDIPITNLTVDDDLIVSSGIADRQVRLFGFTDEDQNPFAISLSNEGVIDDEDVTLQGPVSRVGGNEIEIIGISVDGGNVLNIQGSVEEEDLVIVENAEVDGSTSITDGVVSEIETVFEQRENN
ncbi:DUF5666 domain-containing protein [Sessilibacter corallicola]|uniref:DUF5666 domain-containing protein n=1 Tax=Sessilibacter corallicola TaxID=2904075 RepID=UPI001E54D82B|nr:DUF5666 domain-containing protein [Sessilibacter corallicola]MCE2028813.1 DUF5666 domain-containing protein [Sessilibacter corallicola]